MSQVKKSVQGAVMWWAVAPGLVALAFLLKMISGMFTGEYGRDAYIAYEFKSDLWYLFAAACLTILPFIIQSFRQKNIPE